MYLVYFNCPDYFTQDYFTSVSRALVKFEELKDNFVSTSFDPSELTLTLVNIEAEGCIYTDSFGNLCLENGAKLVKEYDYSEVFMFEEAHNDIDSAFRALEIYLKERGVDWSKIKEDAGIMVYAKTKFNEMHTPKYVGNKIIKLIKE
jgi:hypothetical protein